MNETRVIELRHHGCFRIVTDMENPHASGDNPASETRRTLLRKSSMKQKNKSKKLMWQRGYLGHTLWDGKNCVGRIRLKKNEGNKPCYLCETGTRHQEAESLAAAKRWVRENALLNMLQPQLF
jgi:hypothetical protein